MCTSATKYSSGGIIFLWQARLYFTTEIICVKLLIVPRAATSASSTTQALSTVCAEMH